MTWPNYTEQERQVLRSGRTPEGRKSPRRKAFDDEEKRVAREWLKTRRLKRQKPQWVPPSP